MKKINKPKRTVIKVMHKLRFKPRTIMDMFHISKATFYRYLK